MCCEVLQEVYELLHFRKSNLDGRYKGKILPLMRDLLQLLAVISKVEILLGHCLFTMDMAYLPYKDEIPRMLTYFCHFGKLIYLKEMSL